VPTLAQLSGTYFLAGQVEPLFDVGTQQVPYGTAHVTVNGSLSAGGLIPSGEMVTATLGSQTQTAAVQADGSFSLTLNTAALGASTTPYAIDYSYAGSNAFLQASGTSSLLVTKAASTTTTAGAVPFTYNGNAQPGGSGTVTGAGGLSTSATSLSYSANADGTGLADLVDAGTYYVTAHYAGDANHNASDGAAVAIVIGKAASTTTTVGAGPFTYNASAQVGGSGTVSGVGGLSTSATSLTYSANADGTGTADLVDAGTYYVIAHYAGDANHNASDGTAVAIVINQADLTITANNDTKVYGTLKTFSSTAFTEKGLFSRDSIAGVTEASSGAAPGAAVGTYDIVPSAATGTGLSNYKIHYVNGTLTVFPPITVPTIVQTAYENVNQTISGISIGSGLSGSLTLTLGVGHGKLTMGTTSGLTVTGNGTGSVTLIGTTANLNAALASLVYRGSLNYFGSDNLSVTLTNNGISFNAGVAINVVSIAQEDAALVAQVKALQKAGVLTASQANILSADLSLQGNNGDVGKIGSFINDVNGYVNSHVLTKAQASVLLGRANILLLGLEVEYGG
jgi:hypothetical protein